MPYHSTHSSQHSRTANFINDENLGNTPWGQAARNVAFVDGRPERGNPHPYKQEPTRPEDIPKMGRESFDDRLKDHLQDDSMQSHFTRAGRHLYETIKKHVPRGRDKSEKGAGTSVFRRLRRSSSRGDQSWR